MSRHDKDAPQASGPLLMLAGGLSGTCARTLVAPLDRVRILYQTSNEPFKLRAVPPLIANLVRTEGLLALWRGHAPTLLRVFPHTAVKFSTFEMLKGAALGSERDVGSGGRTGGGGGSRSDGGRQSLTASQSLAFGGVAAGMATVCTYPLELTRSRLAVSPTRSQQRWLSSELLGLWRTWVQKGVRGGTEETWRPS
jgi:hypothetical protein